MAVPSRPGRMAGVRMAGFSDRTKDLIDLQVVPYPAVTVGIDLGDGLLVDHATGQQQRGSVVVGLAPGGSRSQKPRLPGDTMRAGQPTRKSPSPGGRWLPAGDAFGSSGSQPRPDGAASVCGPGSGPRPA